ncbi:sulfurtransferase-like selenium metabolism protein YedF [Desulfofustis glycolicus]|uniref:Selenium metabolism protein YedF n=1 Tax=Desulfofustis glycolicus DSM 9705 TaxID=1121409 RepID=A0A1M5XZ34_9BACT|nr:sulfurtransferase-like selenium metabolism protein YedF [Desulfofustis glycolicus]SHI04976.1 selenium metabolism protein YedF [Desulfofustis glycolicus DSM 9705]
MATQKNLDARGLTCPSPVLLVKDALEAETVPQSLSVQVDNEAARENVTRFLQSRGFTVNSTADGDDWVITATGGAAGAPAPEAVPRPAPAAGTRKIMVVVAATAMGRGDDVLGEKLLISYLKTLEEMGPELWRLVFINGGVKLTVTGSPVLEELQAYERNGLLILACGTCLEHFKLTADKQVGQTTNMLDIVTAMQLADSVITLG